MGGRRAWEALKPATHTFTERLRAIASTCPAFGRGGISWHQLRDLAGAWGRTVGLRVAVDLRHGWPFGGSIQTFGRRLVVFIDAALPDWERRHVLAHEIGHLVLGHYDLDDDIPWFLSDSDGASELEQEAQTFAFLATRSPGLPLEWFLGQ